MIAIAFITFRESLEVLLVMSLLFTSLERLKIDKKRDLLIGAGLGLLFSISFFILFSFAGSRIGFRLEHETGEIIEGVNYLGSGVFLFITAILIHNKMKSIHSQKPSFFLDTSLVAVGFLSVLREGIEIVFFSIPTSLSASFSSSLLGFFIGIFFTFIVGIFGGKFAFTRLSQEIVLRISDWGIKILSLYFIVKGIVVLSEFIL